jgi:hypothetical protein
VIASDSAESPCMYLHTSALSHRLDFNWTGDLMDIYVFNLVDFLLLDIPFICCGYGSFVYLHMHLGVNLFPSPHCKLLVIAASCEPASGSRQLEQTAFKYCGTN